jgi:hypothetical protein
MQTNRKEGRIVTLAVQEEGGDVLLQLQSLQTATSLDGDPSQGQLGQAKE